MFYLLLNVYKQYILYKMNYYNLSPLYDLSVNIYTR